jgi:biotin transport system substrate-specific component
MSVRLDVISGGSLLDACTLRGDFARAVRVTAVVFIAVLTTVAAQVSVPLPFTPVPFTLQPMIVLLGGAALGARLGATSQLLYLAAGIAGLPVFAASPVLPQGVARLLGPTGGFLMSYPLAALVAGTLAERGLDRRYLTSALAMAAGLVVVFACGVSWMAWGAPHLGLVAAFNAGAAPFILADLLKVLLAAAVLPATWRFLSVGRKSNDERRPTND